MKKFRVLSDLHVDYNDSHPIEIPADKQDVFTILCGDTSGDPRITIEWVKKNLKCGVLCSGNHLPYNDQIKTIQDQRVQLAEAFPMDSDITYLDCETNVFSKEVDGILFIGTCMYSNMRISGQYNQNGDINLNKMISHRHMNDYRWGIKELKYDFGTDNEPTRQHITPADYVEWFNNAFKKIDQLLMDNENSQNPKPVVLFTHYPLVRDVVDHSFYVDKDNLASYGNDMKFWIKGHRSIRCYCCGHAHDVQKKFQNFVIKRKDGSSCRVVSNTRGYVSRGHDFDFSIDCYVDTETWKVSKPRKTKKQKEDDQKKADEMFKNLAWFI